jgi:1-acyl-sn-glycerol-3-phosphate acyltransferase
MRDIRSAVTWLLVLPFTLGVCLLLVPARLLPGGKRLTERIVRFWGARSMRMAGIPWKIEGLDRVPLEGACIFVANHQSSVDIPVCLAALPGRVRMMAKRSLFHIPIFGWMLSLEEFIPVDRSTSRKARLSLGPAERFLRKGGRLLIFPEGTRSRDGELGMFKTGAFRLALSTGAPIVPLVIMGADDVLPPKSKRFYPGEVVLAVGEPIMTRGLESSERHPLRDRARAWIEQTRMVYRERVGSGASKD